MEHTSQEWNNPTRSLLFTLSSLSRVVLLAAIAAICMQLAETRAWHWSAGLRNVLGACTFLTVRKLPVDNVPLPDFRESRRAI